MGHFGEGCFRYRVRGGIWTSCWLASLLWGGSVAPLAGAEIDPAIVAHWRAQDGLVDGLAAGASPAEAIARVLAELQPPPAELVARRQELVGTKVPAADPRWENLYLAACVQRRVRRLAPHREMLKQVVFTKHYDLGGSHYAYTEGLSDAQAERHFKPGASLCLWEFDGLEARARTLIDDPRGVIRDPDVSYDGQRVLFAWKKSDREDDYHLYELTVASGTVKQLTFGLGFADYEGCYLPNGDILFNSTRCVQTVDCWWTEVSNLFICNGEGKYIRQVGFDQVHTNYPTVTEDGRVIYTRWDYNDRGQIYPQGLFQMNPDGTGQTELYGNNSYFPTTILHARAIPGTGKYVCIFTGHHTRQQGWLGIIDPGRGRQENAGAFLIAPERETPAERIDRYGQSGDQFQYPYPLGESEFLVAMRPAGLAAPPRGQQAAKGPAAPFAIYWVATDGRRELLAWDTKISCNQPIPLRPRPRPPVRPSLVDYRQRHGTVYLHDVYAGPGLVGVPRGTIRALRVVALEFRAAGVGSNQNRGPAGDALVSTPISIGGAWDVKIVLGTAKVHADGSACFRVPARTPLYFQALDEKGRMVQTMRSWTTLQPGEVVSCVGCHEDKNAAPPVTAASEAMRCGPQELEPFYGPPRGFSFIREIQPILDRHCVRCHFLKEGDAPPDASALSETQPTGIKPAFSLQGTQIPDAKAMRLWSVAYQALLKSGACSWISPQSPPPMLPPYHAGAAKSRLLQMLEKDGHHGVKLSQSELDRFIVWLDLLVPYCGDYTEAMLEIGLPKYRHFLEKRRRWQAEEAENIRQYLRSMWSDPGH